MSELEVQQLVKRFGNNLVVDHINFKVNSGEFFVLLGPSGGGKTTLLRMLCGLEQADEGRILINNQDVTQLTPRQRNIGMVFQDYGLYPNMDVYGNIAYGLEARNMARAEIDKRVKMGVEMLGLTPHLRRSIVDLSGGEQQRVALTRALVKDAEVYLYDEPLSNLDPKLRYQARKDILKVHRTKLKPSVYVTHDQSEAFAMGDRIAVIAKGQLQQIGTPDELLQSPANIFMARFVGTPPMNIIRGRVQLNNGFSIVQTNDIRVNLPPIWRGRIERTAGAEVLVGIRPTALIPEWGLQHLEYQPKTAFKAQITDIEALVGETVVTLKTLDGTTLVAIFEDSEVEPEIGRIVTIYVDEEQLRLFDVQTEQALK